VGIEAGTVVINGKVLPSKGLSLSIDFAQPWITKITSKTDFI
jgi:hypothetical protein